MLTRWVWELLQNARDAAVDTDTSLIASVELTTDELVFRHTGANFRISEMAHLIYHGSTKIEDFESIGQYGSGFLATHLLSPEIEIAGQLADGRHFSFPLRREVGSVRDLSNSMAQAQKDFKESLSSNTIANDFTTEFRYRLKEGAVDAVEEGIRALKQCAPFVVAFNKEFSSIIVNSATETVEFKVVQRMPLDRDGLQQVTVSQVTDEAVMDRVIVLAQSGQTSVAFPLATDDDTECLAVGYVPRLFLGFPLIGTEDFSFPAVINSFEFHTDRKPRRCLYRPQQKRKRSEYRKPGCGSNSLQAAHRPPPVRGFVWLAQCISSGQRVGHSRKVLAEPGLASSLYWGVAHRRNAQLLLHFE